MPDLWRLVLMGPAPGAGKGAGWSQGHRATSGRHAGLTVRFHDARQRPARIGPDAVTGCSLEARETKKALPRDGERTTARSDRITVRSLGPHLRANEILTATEAVISKGQSVWLAHPRIAGRVAGPRQPPVAAGDRPGDPCRVQACPQPAEMAPGGPRRPGDSRLAGRRTAGRCSSWPASWPGTPTGAR